MEGGRGARLHHPWQEELTWRHILGERGRRLVCVCTDTTVGSDLHRHQQKQINTISNFLKNVHTINTHK